MSKSLSKHKRLILEIAVLLLLVCAGSLSAYTWSNYEYGQGYINGHANGYHIGYLEGYKQGRNNGYQQGYNDGQATGYENGHNDGYQAGDTQGKQDELQVIADWIYGSSCAQSSSGYISFKMWKDSAGTWNYTCLVNTY